MTPRADVHSAVRSQPPPEWVMRHVVNPVVRVLLRFTLGRVTGRLSLLRFDGRRTGRSYAVPVVLHLVDDVPTVFTPGTWAVNFRGSGHRLTVVSGGRQRVALGVLVEDQKARGAAMRHAIAESGSPRKLGLAIDANHFATDAELCAVRSMIRIEFD